MRSCRHCPSPKAAAEPADPVSVAVAVGAVAAAGGDVVEKAAAFDAAESAFVAVAEPEPSPALLD